MRLWRSCWTIPFVACEYSHRSFHPWMHCFCNDNVKGPCTLTKCMPDGALQVMLSRLLNSTTPVNTWRREIEEEGELYVFKTVENAQNVMHLLMHFLARCK